MTFRTDQTSSKATDGSIPQRGPETAELLWWQASDGTRVFVRLWRAAKESAVVIYLHGIEGHSRWFEGTALDLAASGITVYAPDRRGAGQSEGPRGDLRSYQRYVSDIDEFVHYVLQNTDSPIFLVANCWGAKAAILAAQRNTTAVLKGIVLTSPAVCVKVDVDFLTKVKIGLDYFTRSPRPHAIPLTPQHFTDVAAYLSYIEEDPFRLKEATASFFVESLKLTAACKAAASKLKLPVLMLQSGHDEIVDVSTTQKWFNSLPIADKQFELFPDFTHSLDFDPAASLYIQKLRNWILSLS